MTGLTLPLATIRSMPGLATTRVNIDLGPFGSGVLSQAVVGSKLEIQRGGLAIADSLLMPMVLRR